MNVPGWIAHLGLVGVMAGVSVAQQVHVVDGAGGGDHLDLASALAVVAEGDTVLVRPGFYVNSLIDRVALAGTSISIVGDAADPPWLPPLTVSDLLADQSVTLADVQFLTPSGTTASDGSPALTLVDCAGPVWIEDCTFQGGTAIFPFPFPAVPDGTPGLSVTDSPAVTIVGSALRGGDGCHFVGGIGQSNNVRDGGPGLIAVNAAVTLYDCEATGGDGGSAFGTTLDGRPGGAGVEAQGSEVVLVDCTLQGGDGGPGCNSPSYPFCSGGDGLRIDAASLVAILDSSFAPGAAGGANGLPGQDEVVPAGATRLDWPGPAPTLLVGSPAVENTVTTIRYEGQPGDTFGLFFSYDPGFFPLYGKQGVFALGSPYVGPTLVWTVAAPDGVFEVPFTAWDLTPFPFDAGTIYGQCFTKPASGPTLLSAPASLTILDDAL